MTNVELVTRVLFDGDLPIASINVCFECGDILTWPDSEIRFDDPAWESKYARRKKLYDAVFPKWKPYFRDELGLPVAENRF